MPRARDAVEDHAGDLHRGVVARKAERGGGGGLCLTRHVDHQHHRPAHPPRNVRACAVAGRARLGDAVEQAHRPLREYEIGIVRFRGEAVEHRLRHGPAVEVERRPSARRAVEGGVDIIGAALERLDAQAFVAERAEQA